MRRFWILLLTQLKAWRGNPLPILGGFIAPLVILIAFGFMFSGTFSFPIVVLNHDRGPAGEVLLNTLDETLSPFDQPYYQRLDLPEDEAWTAFNHQRIDGIWVIPTDFSERIKSGNYPTLQMHFLNYHDDRAKNHRLYAQEILWRFYEKMDLPEPPLEIAEDYPLPQMVDWFSLIAVGVVLLGGTLGGMFNIFMLTFEEQIHQITIEYGLSPRSLAELLLPKVIMAFCMSLLTSSCLLVILWIWKGIWLGSYLWAVWILIALVATFWIAVALMIGLRARHYMPGAIGMVLTGVTIFFVGGGLAPVRFYPKGLIWVASLFPNTHAIDPLRELILFHKLPENWGAVLLILSIFALSALSTCLFVSKHYLRRIH